MARLAPARPASRAGLVAGLALLLIALAAGGALYFVKRAASNIVIPPTNIADSQGVPANTGMYNPMSGMFVEKDSKSETPRLTITNDTSDTIHLLLKDETGRVYHVDAQPYESGSLDIPSGHYDVAVTSDDPTVNQNTGDALFRAHKEYSTEFVIGPGMPIHMGD